MSREQTLAKKGADRYFSQFIRSRGSCQRCGQRFDPSELQCAHIIRRRYSRTRCEQDNAWALDAKCHLRVDTDPAAFMELVDSTIGRERYEELYALAHDTTAPLPHWPDVRDQWRELLKAVRADHVHGRGT